MAAMAVGGLFQRLLRIFRAPPAPVLGALDGEEFFAIEGSLPISLRVVST